MRKLLKNILNRSFGKKRAQSFYENLFRLSLKGMNYGNGGDYKESGELHLLSYVNEKLKNESSITVFDVGANVGHYAEAASNSFGSRATIHSFEPSYTTFQSLIKNTTHLKNIVPNNFGLSGAEGTLLLYTNIAGSGLASVYHRNLGHMGISMDQSEEIKLSTIDQYSNANNIDRIHFLKLDIEGHELNALKGATKLLSQKRIDFIQFEFGGTNIDSRTFFKDFYLLLHEDFRIYRVVKDGLVEVPNYTIRQEIFVSINYLAEKR